MTAQKKWTMLELQRLVEMRRRNLSLKEIAVHLGRSWYSVSRRLYKLRVTIHRRRSTETIHKLRMKVKRLVGMGRCDAWIAIRLGLPKYTVTQYRQHLKLKANVPQKSRQAVCDGCGKRSPIPIGPGWEKMVGWTHWLYWEYSDRYLCYCPSCTKLEESRETQNEPRRVGCPSREPASA